MSKMVSRLWIFVVAAAWLVSSTCNARNDFLFMSPERIPEKLTFQPIVPFHTAHATRTRYQDFIQNVREEMLSLDKVQGISRLQKPDSFLNTDRYIQVALFSKDGARIILAIDRANANVVGYRSKGTAYIFPDIDVPSNVFEGIHREKLSFKSSYSAIEKVAGNRTNLRLGMEALDNSIKHVDESKTSYLVNSQAVFLLVASQMVSDAVRYRFVEKTIIEQITDEKSYVFFPNATMITLEDNWILLSTRIQQAAYGVIDPEFVLPGVSNPISSIYPILGPQIAFILYVCDDCPTVEPTVSLIGRNGLCADVQDSFYYDGNPVILWPCTKNPNQLFTLMNDGTIQCNGKCLTAYQLKKDRYVMIHNCTTAPENSGIKWKVEDNGNIINTEHKLALSAYVGYAWSLLTVDQILYASRQGWSFRTSSNGEPAVTPILSSNGMYLQAQNGTVQLVKGNGNSIPKWQIYSDGTIRPTGTKLFCVARESDDTNVTIQLCDGGSAERWFVHYDGLSIIISDATNQYVLEVNKDQKVMVVKGSADKPTTEQIFTIDIKLQ